MKSTVSAELTSNRALRADRSLGMNQPRSLDDWSNWFRRSEPPALAIRVIQDPEFHEEMAAEMVVPMISKPRRVASLAKKSARPTAERPRRRESRRVVDALRSKCQRLRTFDDWSNWFWKGGSPEDLSLA